MSYIVRLSKETKVNDFTYIGSIYIEYKGKVGEYTHTMPQLQSWYESGKQLTKTGRRYFPQRGIVPDLFSADINGHRIVKERKYEFMWAIKNLLYSDDKKAI